MAQQTDAITTGLNASMTKLLFGRLVFILVLAFVFCPALGRAQDITGSGSTFAFPILMKWIEAFQKAGGGPINYQPVGSARGISEVGAKLVDFAITDAPRVDAQLLRDGLLQFPIVMGAIVPVVNLDGVKPGTLHLTGAVLADIYLNKIKSWRDAAIAKLNPMISLPDTPILVVYRSDGSGTTYNWTDFLSKNDTLWQAHVGTGTTVQWPVGVSGQGNGGIAEKVARVKGAIGYVEYSYAVSHALSYALVGNRSGAYVPPDPKSFLAAIEGVDWTATPDFAVMLTDAPQPDAYPLMATSFVLIRKYATDLERYDRMMKFFRWVLEHGQAHAASLGYLALPASLVQQVEGYWEAQIHHAAN